MGKDLVVHNFLKFFYYYKRESLIFFYYNQSACKMYEQIINMAKGGCFV